MNYTMWERILLREAFASTILPVMLRKLVFQSISLLFILSIMN